MTTRSYPKVATREEYSKARAELLTREKAVTHERDAVNALRRRLPMVLVDKDYVFEGATGDVHLRDMFEDTTQLYIHHFMWIDARGEGCPSCTQSVTMTFTPTVRAALKERDVTIACISRAPFAELERWRTKHGWTFPWYSAKDPNFATDLDVTRNGVDRPACSVFIRRGDAVYHTYSAFERGQDHLALPYAYLDLTPYGRQEAWEDSPPGWPQRRTPE